MGLLSTESTEKFIIIGKGNQALAWAHNFKLSKRPYALALRSKSSIEHPQVLIGPELKNFSNFALLIPDESHEKFLQDNADFLPKNARILYAHGYSVLYQNLTENYPQFDHLLYAPKSIAGQIVINRQKNLQTAVFCSQEFSSTDHKDFLEQLSKDLHFFIASYGSFKEEVVADLFSEQTLLCGLYPFMIAEAYNLLNKNGINKKLSFLECWHESKLIMETLIEKGPREFFKMISPNALYGSMEASKILFDDQFKEKLELIFNNIQSGEFEKRIKQDYKIDEAKDQMDLFWKNSDLQQTFEEFKGQLYQ